MNIKKLIAAAIAAVSAFTVLTLGASAYELNKNLGTGWSANATVPGDEFAGLTDTTAITVTYTADQALADSPTENYWAFKPMINDAGWPLIDGISQLPPTEDGSAYVIDPAATSITFSIPTQYVEHVATAGMAIIGHGITLGEITFSDEPIAAPEAPAAEAPTAEKGNPTTGVEGVAVAVTLLVASAIVLTASRKK